MWKIFKNKFSSVWKIARVVPIPKTKNIHVLDDLRPMSILPALSKAVEHILKSQIMCSVSENDMRELSFNINSIIYRFLSWTLINSLSVNINKTKGMLFGISDTLESELDICFNGV